MAEAARRVAIIGGGWAGCAAAMTLSRANVSITLFEQAPALGGRARKVMHEGIGLDNGQHLLLGAYRQTLNVLAQAHETLDPAPLFRRFPLTLRAFGNPNGSTVELSAWRASPPLHLAGAVLSARGLSLSERLALIADYRRLEREDFRRPAGETVAQCFDRTPRRVFEAIWAPLCLAALNTPAHSAAATMFAHVLGSAFTGVAANSDFLVPLHDLSATFPDAAIRSIERAGGIVRRGTAVRGITRFSGGVTLQLAAGSESFSAVVIAVGPHQLAATLGNDVVVDEKCRRLLEQVAAFSYESITTIFLALSAPTALSVPVMRLDDAPGQWIFDRSAALRGDDVHKAKTLLAAVISGSGPHDALDHAQLAHDVEAQVRRLSPGLPEIVFRRVIAEKRATYSCKPGLARPSCGRVAPGIYLAGDYTDPEFPATLEAATRSGCAAAKALLDDRGSVS